MIQPQLEQRPSGPRHVILVPLEAKRKARVRRRHYGVIALIVGWTGLLALPLLIYLALMAQMTAFDYSLGRANAERASLIDETQRLDERIAGLESRERLAGVGARLGMHEAAGDEMLVVVRPQRRPPADAPRHVAFFGAVAEWWANVPR